jgi:hypothetical protein
MAHLDQEASGGTVQFSKRPPNVREPLGRGPHQEDIPGRDHGPVGAREGREDWDQLLRQTGPELDDLQWMITRQG